MLFLAVPSWCLYVMEYLQIFFDLEHCVQPLRLPGLRHHQEQSIHKWLHWHSRVTLLLFVKLNLFCILTSFLWICKGIFTIKWPDFCSNSFLKFLGKDNLKSRFPCCVDEFGERGRLRSLYKIQNNFNNYTIFALIPVNKSTWANLAQTLAEGCAQCHTLLARHRQWVGYLQPGGNGAAMGTLRHILNRSLSLSNHYALSRWLLLCHSGFFFSPPISNSVLLQY